MQGRTVTILAGCALAQGMPAAAQEAAAAATSPARGTIVLARDTPVVLLATSEVRSDHVAAGTLFKLRVQQPISVGGAVIVPVGTPAFGQVVSAEGSGGLGKSGTMDVKLRYIQLGDARIPLEGEKAAKGTGAGSAGMAVLFVGVTGLFHRGNNAKIKAGELLSGFVAQDVTLDLAAAPIRLVEAAAQTPRATAP